MAKPTSNRKLNSSSSPAVDCSFPSFRNAIAEEENGSTNDA